MSGRPPKPANLHVVHGTRSQVGRTRGNAGVEPDPAHLVDIEPPAHLSEGAAAIWRDLAPKLRDAHLLTELDAFALEKLCVSIDRWRRLTAMTEDRMVIHRPPAKALAASEDRPPSNEETGSCSISPYVFLQQMYANQADATMSRFGMSPSDRARIRVNPQADLFPSHDDKASRHFR